jgi:alkaline phosphatase
VLHNSLNGKYRLKILAVLILVQVLGAGLVFGAEVFSYQMSEPPTDTANAFYQPVSKDFTLPNIPYGEVHSIIFCIGDGMGINHIALARHQGVGTGKKLTVEYMPVSGLARTYSASSHITDSAAAGTALACGIKTDNGMLGMAPDKTPYCSILEVLDRKGWRTGLVATSTISHATPASFASHVDARKKQEEIAAQLLGNHVDVLFGGGAKYWDDALLAKAADDGYKLIKTRDEMLALKAEPVIGLFADDGMTTLDPEPSLAEMSRTAINLLSSKSKEWFAPKPKFFLMIEGSQIDWAAHANDTERVVRQMLLFDLAVREAIEFARRDRHTLVIVTADHETGGLTLDADKDQNGKEHIKAGWSSKSHTAGDVPVYAYGPGSTRFAGVMNNTDIPKRITELTGINKFPVVKDMAKQEAAVK